MLRFKADKIIVPGISSQFGYWVDKNQTDLQKMEETSIYKEDLIGLQVLNEQGKVVNHECELDHLELMESEVYKYLLPALTFNE